MFAICVALIAVSFVVGGLIGYAVREQTVVELQDLNEQLVDGIENVKEFRDRQIRALEDRLELFRLREMAFLRDVAGAVNRTQEWSGHCVRETDAEMELKQLTEDFAHGRQEKESD